MRVLKEAGISDYSIWLDPETRQPVAIPTRAADPGMDARPRHEIWCAEMADIMETDADDVPHPVPLLPMFHLP